MADEEKKKDAALEGVPLFLISLLLMPFGIVLWGWVLQHSWNWFMPVVDPRIPAATFTQAVAARAVFGILTAPLSVLAPERSARKRVAQSAVWIFIVPFIVLFFQWLLHLVVHI